MSGDGKLDGDVAIVTGAGRNIGRAIAETLADAGAQVVVVDQDESAAEATVASITEAGNQAIPVEVDISDEGQVRGAIETVEAGSGPVDILVNNAAIREPDQFFDLSVETFDRVLAVNLRGTFICTREAAQSMKRAGGGRVVNLSSTSGRRGRPTGIAYATSKAGILNFTRSAAKALAPYDIRVNTVTPTRTGRTTHSPSGSTRRDQATEQETIDAAIREDIPVGRLGQPSDIASAVAFLVHPESEFITGTELLVDGGRSS